MAGGKQKGKIAPYLVYANEVREDVKRALVDAGAVKPTMGEIAKAVGVRWKTLSDAQKATYKEKADAINAETAATRAADAEGGEAGEDGDDEDGEEEIVTLPLARVKRIMKCDKEVKTAAVDAAKVVSKATELFLESLTEGAFLGMKAGKRKTVKYDDLEGFVMRKPRLEFLHDHDKENKEDGDEDGGPPEAPSGARQVTEFFTKKAATPAAATDAAAADGDDGDDA
ncbi:uncharacterized protein MICPUCDRAFT_40449 [Micromonas pusilla CCMP1545]|uniref:Predicted protein n=1 Tax=Micromonas pusilla (strain CCMP1545) TaxID=564608 RepID=C1MWR7_MICPC|nr:uncharacterized protein MICPUCDRAFT_40449 [Micromonas pusilla CCMP1545]EEH55923.1 predicted protein [Micromonas pusilla CCMP1545]|eukprot:XP_003059971.1 predicted protein [Micromonas pusilla CCMP1545]